MYQAIQAGSGGYNSNQILPIGYFTGSVEIPICAREGSIWEVEVEPAANTRTLTYNSSTTTKNTSNGRIEIVSSDSLTITKSGGSSFETSAFEHFFAESEAEWDNGNSITEVTVPINMQHLDLIPDGTYVVNLKGYPISVELPEYGDEHTVITDYDDLFATTTQQTVDVVGGVMNIKVNTGGEICITNVYSYYSAIPSTTLIADFAFVFTKILQIA